MSCTPYALTPCGYDPTGAVRWRLVWSELDRPASQFSPQGYRRPSAPRAAFSHSASVGSRLPTKRQNASASHQDTPTTGWVGPFHFESLKNCGCMTALEVERP